MRRLWWLVLGLVLFLGVGLGDAAGEVVMEKVAFGGWQNCIRLTNGEIELVVTTDVGPRVIRAAFIHGTNFFKEYEEQWGKTGGSEWRIYGGHRSWHAPEAAPRTYSPDNNPVAYEWDGKTLVLRQPVEADTGIRKELAVTLADGANHVTLVHRHVNENLWDVTLAPWALTVMAQKGRAIFPQEEYRPHPEYLLPARPLVLWHYTDMADPRWTWGTKYIQLQQNPEASTKQKVGMLNKQGWLAYVLDGGLFLKLFVPQPDAPHPDYGCNTETYTDAGMLEMETLGPLALLKAEGGSVEHVEHWFLHSVSVGMEEPAIDAAIVPLVEEGRAMAATP